MSRKKSSGTWCAGINCHHSRMKNPRLSFFNFPKEKERYSIWVANSKREDFEKNDYDFIAKTRSLCEDHFETSQFMNPMDKGVQKKFKRLMPNATPTLFNIPRSSHLLLQTDLCPVEKEVEDMPNCAAVGCSNRSELGYLMKSFPSDPKRRALWEAKINRNNWKATKYSRICEIHFDDDQWEKTRVDGTRRLKCSAIPTLFNHTEQTLPTICKPFRPSKLKTRKSKSLDSTETLLPRCTTIVQLIENGIKKERGKKNFASDKLEQVTMLDENISDLRNSDISQLKRKRVFI